MSTFQAVLNLLAPYPEIVCGLPEAENRYQAWRVNLYHKQAVVGVVYVSYANEQIIERLSTPLAVIEKRYCGDS